MDKKRDDTANSRLKEKGQVFTPSYIVKAMLDWCGYRGHEIIGKHVTDNSCGDGAFLVEVVHRYIQAAFDKGLSPSVVKKQLKIYIHGLDNDPEAIAACRKRLDEMAAQYGITGVTWRIYQMDSLACRFFDGMMDYVVGNPPYVRVHNLNDITHDLLHECPFTDKGMTDLYLAFFALAFRTLKKGGQLCYITPVSWIYSKAGRAFREYIMQQRNMVELVDMGHHQIFTNVSTYTIVSRFIKGLSCDNFVYSLFDPTDGHKYGMVNLTLSESYMDHSFYLADKSTLLQLRQIKSVHHHASVKVKNGFATLADKIFFSEEIPDSPFTIQAVKASTGVWMRCFYPYHDDGTPVTFEELSVYPVLKSYLEKYKQELCNRDVRQTEWWLYGRTQAITCVSQDKLSVNALVRDVEDLKIQRVPERSGVYAGYYITAPDSSTLEQIGATIKTTTFINYVKALKKYKSGGYYTFSAKDLEQFLHYHLSKFVQTESRSIDEQSKVEPRPTK